MGIYSIKKMAAVKARGNEKSAGVGIRASYLRVVGIQIDTEGAGKEEFVHFIARVLINMIVACSKRIKGPGKMFSFFFVSSRSWCLWISLSTGRGGAESAGCFSKHLRLSGTLRRSLHLRQRRSKEGHHLSVVWRFKEEVRLPGKKSTLQISNCKSSPVHVI